MNLFMGLTDEPLIHGDPVVFKPPAQNKRARSTSLLPVGHWSTRLARP